MFKKIKFTFTLSLLLLGTSVNGAAQPRSWSLVTNAFTQNMGNWLGGMNRVIKENPYMGIIGIGGLALAGGIYGYWKYSNKVKKLTASQMTKKEENFGHDCRLWKEMQDLARKRLIKERDQKKSLEEEKKARIEDKKNAQRSFDRRILTANREQVQKTLFLGDELSNLKNSKNEQENKLKKATEQLAKHQLEAKKQSDALVKKNNELETTIGTLTNEIKKIESEKQEISKYLLQEQRKHIQVDSECLNDLSSSMAELPESNVEGDSYFIGAAFIENFLIKACKAGIIVDSEELNTDKPTKKQVYDWIKKGGAYAYHLFDQGETASIPTETEDLYLDSIISLTWYFFAHAILKNEAFTQGSFMIFDPKNRLYDFLMSYAKKVNPITLDTQIGSVSAPWDCNGYAYKRHSSHLKKSVATGPEFHHYGIDVRFKGEEQSNGTRGWAKPWLPAQKKHILFGKVKVSEHQDSMVFFKIEDYGLFKTDGYPQHAGDFGVSVGRKLIPFVFGSDDALDYRKERIEGAVKKKVKELVSQFGSPLTTEEQSQVITEVSTYGIQSFYNYVQKWLDQKNFISDYKEWIEHVQGYRNELSAKYDHIDVRYGREVILDKDDMFDAEYYKVFVEKGYDANLYNRTQSLLSRKNINKQ